MKRVSHQQQTYLDERARIHGGARLHDYEQVLGENALVWIDIMMDRYFKTRRSNQQYNDIMSHNMERWAYLIDNEGIQHSTQWQTFQADKLPQKSVHAYTDALLRKAYTDVFRGITGYYRQVLAIYRLNVRGNSLGRLCGFSGWWHRPYDAARAHDIQNTMKQLWTNYIYALLTLGASVRDGVSEQQLYHNCTMVILHAKKYGKRWDSWIHDKI